MGVSLSVLRATWDRTVVRPALAPAVRAMGVLAAASERLGIGRLRALADTGLRPPAAAWALAALLLGQPTSGSGLRDLVFGILLLLVLERTLPPLAVTMPLGLRALPPTPAAAALLALSAAAAHGSGLLVLVLLVLACELARRWRRLPLADALCRALGAALRVDAGALLLGGGRSALLPVLVGAAVLLSALAEARATPVASEGPARLVGRTALDLLLLGAFAFLLAAALALPSELGLLGPVPSAWAVLGWPLLAIAALAVLGAATAPSGGGSGTRFARVAAAAGFLWIVTLVLAARSAGAG